MKVLLVDPDATRVSPLKQTLLAGGAEVTVAASGSFALTMLEWNRHDVVLSRAHLGDMDGHELCAILKADPGTREVRFVLVAGAEDVTTAETAAASVDLVLPPAMTGSAIVPLILRLMRADRGSGMEARGSGPGTPPPVAEAPAPGPSPAAEADGGPVPLMRPAAPSAPEADPPRRYVTAATAEAAAPWSKSSSESAVGQTTPAPPPRLAPPTPRPTFPPPSRPAPSSPARRSSPAPRPTAPPGPPAAPRRPAVARPGGPPAPAATSPGPTPPPRTPTAPVTAAEVMAVPSGTFQGSLEVMELADLTQAIAAGGKSGRLILALPQGGGLLLFEGGRVVHAEYRNTVGEEAFGALLAACQGEPAGRFCFLPGPSGQASGLPRTIDKTVDRLLLSSATAIDEKG